MFERNIDRVEAQTRAEINEDIQRSTEARICHLAQHPEQIPQRLRQLEKEWDVERALETGASTLSLTGLLLSITRSRGWVLLPLAVQSFFLQHAIQGWCPPLSLFRRLGFRTMREILEERSCLIQILAEYRGRPRPTEPIQGGPAMGRPEPGIPVGYNR